MARPDTPRLHWTPGTKPERVTEAKPRRKPAPGDVPAAPLELPALPPRRLRPEPAETPPADTATAVPVQATAAPAAAEPTATGPSGGALLAAGVALYRREVLLARWDIDADELAGLRDDGIVLEVPLGRLTRYVPAEDVPAGLLPGATDPAAVTVVMAA